MPRTLKSRNSTIQLIDIQKCGGVDVRSEIGRVISVDDWLLKPETRLICSCEQVKDEQLIPSHLMLTDQYLYILRPTNDEGQLVIKVRRKLTTVMKITTKAKLCDVVKLQYGSKGVDGDVHITDSDKLVIPKKSAHVIKTIKSILQPKTGHASPSRRSSLATPPNPSLLQPPKATPRRRSSVTSETKYGPTSDESNVPMVRRASVGARPEIPVVTGSAPNGSKFSTVSALVEHHFLRK